MARKPAYVQLFVLLLSVTFLGIESFLLPVKTSKRYVTLKPMKAMGRELVTLLKEVEEELDTLKGENEDSNERKKSLIILLKCRDAINQIDSDLDLFTEHMNGTDEKLKETSTAFHKEFSECRVQLLAQMEKALGLDSPR